MILETALAGLASAGGHLVRDGTPPLGSTTLARVTGALAPGLAVAPCFWVITRDWKMAAIAGGGLAMQLLASYYLDQKHGEGQEFGRPGSSDTDAGAYAAISGTSSMMALLATSIGLFAHTRELDFLLFGVACLTLGMIGKPAVWWLSWKIIPRPKRDAALQPTRLAAVVWGALFGALYGAMFAIALVKV